MIKNKKYIIKAFKHYYHSLKHTKQSTIVIARKLIQTNKLKKQKEEEDNIITIHFDTYYSKKEHYRRFKSETNSLNQMLAQS